MTGSIFINGKWIVGDGEPFSSIDPSTGDIVWTNRSGNHVNIDDGVSFARCAFASWSAFSIDQRAEYLRSFAEQLKADRENLATLISRETGKPLWESRIEVDAMAGKIAISIEAQRQRRSDEIVTSAGTTTATRYKPLGVIVVLGPFNFPGHLPNGHIVPALLAGNCIVFKPSELTPGVAERTVQLWQRAGLPAGVLNLIQGGGDIGAALVNHTDIDGVCFTGSFSVGQAIHRALAGRPRVMCALEMGGNNPLIVDDVADLDAAAYHAIRSAFLSAGQRCSCARRLIVPRGANGDTFINRFIAMTKRIAVSRFDAMPEPFMGPVIHDRAARRLLEAQHDLLSSGGESLVEMKSLGATPAMLSPGIVDVTKAKSRGDEEYFGPLLQLIRVHDFDAAIAEANNTRFGLAAGLFCDDRAKYEQFFSRIRAGVVNFNRPLTGASSSLPFGGIGDSGNHQPSAFFATDYCSFPVASMEIDRVTMPSARTPGLG